jgi:hypothetical protein
MRADKKTGFLINGGLRSEEAIGKEMRIKCVVRLRKNWGKVWHFYVVILSFKFESKTYLPV